MAGESGFDKVRTPLDWPQPGQSKASPIASPEDGETREFIILTESAQEEVRRLVAAEGEGTGLRLGIKGGGCSGLSYVLDFTQEAEGDTVIDFEGFQVFLDRKSTIYLSGVSLDFQSGLNGRGFLFTNPQASNTCGCGESFSL